MREYDVAIVGAGLAGSIAATMLARAGHAVAVIDPSKTYPDDFRVEKFDDDQIRTLRRTGLCDVVLAAATHDRSVWVSLLGRLAEKRASDQRGFDYGALVNLLRREMPPSVTQVHAKATAVANSSDRQQVTLSTGDTIDAHLVVLASGLNNGLRDGLGIERMDLVRCQSVTFGFDMEPAAGSTFPFRALTYYGEQPCHRVAYITLFPIGARMRANLFVYRDLADPWLRAFRDAPEATLASALPRLARIAGPFRVVAPVKMRPVDLFETRGYLQPGLVLVGDAFSTACPAAGTGARKALVDVERLCNVHAPQWLATQGMGVEKIAAFYTDPEKMASDRNSLALAHAMKRATLDESVSAWGRRFAKLSFLRARWATSAASRALTRMAAQARPVGAPAGSADPQSGA